MELNPYLQPPFPYKTGTKISVHVISARYQWLGIEQEMENIRNPSLSYFAVFTYDLYCLLVVMLLSAVLSAFLAWNVFWHQP